MVFSIYSLGLHCLHISHKRTLGLFELKGSFSALCVYQGGYENSSSPQRK